MPETREGAATIAINDGVFFNPKMKKLRDISVMLLSATCGAEGCKVLDATSATGVRGIRYALESNAANVTFLDINEKAAANTSANVIKNNISAHVANMSIQEFANTCGEHFDVIDIDPFGSAAPYIYDIMKISKDKTLLMVTATDTAVLCGAHRLACLKTYGAEPIHNELCHESGLRILISFIAKISAQFNFGIEVLLAIADMHYMRVFIRLHKGASNAVESVKQIGYVGYCSHCHNFSFAKGVSSSIDGKCNYCGSTMTSYGPLWLGSLHDSRLLNSIIKSNKDRSDMAEALSMLNAISIEADIPFSYSMPKITKFLRISSVAPKEVVKLLQKGNTATETLFCEGCIKTDAEIGTVIDAVRKLASER